MPIDVQSAGIDWSPQQIPLLTDHAPTGQSVAARSQPQQIGKVLHIINGEHFSGAERVQQLLGKRLGSYGFAAEFACVKPNKFPELCELRRGQVCQFPMHGRFDLSIISALVKKVRDDVFDILHAHTPRTAMVAALVSARSGVPWVYHIHSPTARDSSQRITNRINQVVERVALGTCAQLITVSRSLRREMLRCGFPRTQVSLVPNGVSVMSPADASTRVSSQQWRLGLIALMRPRKGVEVALEAMHVLRQQGQSIKLDLIGGFESPAYQQHVLEMCKSLRLQDCVRWTGFTNDVPSVLRRLDGLLLPSLFGEGMPMVVLEALASAVPVVATRVEGTPEVIREGVEGCLAQPGDPHSFAQAIQRLTVSRESWLAMSQRAVARQRSAFTDHRMAQRVARIYLRLLTSGKHAR